MKPVRRSVPRLAAMGRPEVFMVFEHAVSIAYQPEGHWTVSVDGRLVSGTFQTRVEAWMAGVRAADIQDRLRTA
jgi:hypothetical protein